MFKEMTLHRRFEEQMLVPVCGYFLLMIWRLLDWLDSVCERKGLTLVAVIAVASVNFFFNSDRPLPRDEFYLFN